VRTPSRVEEDARLTAAYVPGFQIPGQPPVPPSLVTIDGNRDLRSEEVVALEMGYRAQPLDWFSLDSAAFLNFYDALRTNSREAPVFEPLPAPGLLRIPARYDNKASGETFGAELSARFRITDFWRITANYSYLQMNLHADPTHSGTNPERDEDRSPHHQFQLLSRLDLPHDVQFDVSAYWVDRLELADDVPPWARLDVRVGWRPITNLDVSLIGRNLLDDRHPEARPTFLGFPETEQQRSGLIRVSWKF
jgi:iron complex outermembrane receptor protein